MDSVEGSDRQLAIFGGPKAVTKDPSDIFTWPITTKEDEEAVLDVLRRGAMSDTDVTKQFETEYAAWQGTTHALGFSSGTMTSYATKSKSLYFLTSAFLRALMIPATRLRGLENSDAYFSSNTAFGIRNSPRTTTPFVLGNRR